MGRRERGILFKGEMVRAILAGTKTVTRRTVKPQPPTVESVLKKAGIDFGIFTRPHMPGVFSVSGPVWAVRDLMGREPMWRCPYGQPGDRLWVKETWSPDHRDVYPMIPIVYRADHSAPDGRDAKEHVAECRAASGGPRHFECQACAGFRWRSALFMARSISRIDLEIVSVRVERLQAITEEEARAEGVESHAAFAAKWDEINGAGSFDADPWVWRIEFRRVPHG